MELSIPTHNDSAIQGDPAFATLRRHNETFFAGVQVMFGAGVAVGAELIRLRAQIKPTRGGAERFSSPKDHSVAFGETPTWKELVRTHSGAGHEHARRCEKVASDLRKQIASSRDKDSVRARKLIDDPSLIVSFDDYATLARVVGRTYDADTWTGILIEAGVIRRPVSNPGTKEIGEGGGSGKADPVLEARLLARAWLERLREPVRNLENWRKRLALLPVDPTGDPEEPSLLEYRDTLADQITHIDEMIARKKAA